MIVDNIKNATLYFGMSNRIESALKYLQKTDFSKINPGKIFLDGTNLYAVVQSYESKALNDGKWEAHRRYIDVQYIFEGIERIGYTNINNLNVAQEYCETDDYLLLKGSGDYLTLRAGDFAIFYPEDAHMPGISYDKPQQVKKVVVKVAL